jgi:uncharacterized protein (UPF0276 family)
MIALALTDRPLTRSLLAARAVACEYFETAIHFADSAVECFPGYAMLLHNAVANWSLGHPHAVAQTDVLPLTRQRLHATGAPWLSVHLGFSAAEVVFDGVTRARSPVLGREQLLTTVCHNLTVLRAALPVPVIVENLDYNPSGAYEHICEPAFIRAVAERSGVGLLLDLAHAQVSAAALGMSITAYLTALPLERVRQLHVSRPCWRDGRLVDVHEALTDQDYALLEEVLTMTEPRAITLEYHRDAQALCRQMDRLRSILNAPRRTPSV